MEKTRKYYKCGKEIKECMGFVKASDFLIAQGGPLKEVEELCDKCACKDFLFNPLDFENQK